MISLKEEIGLIIKTKDKPSPNKLVYHKQGSPTMKNPTIEHEEVRGYIYNIINSTTTKTLYLYDRPR